MESCKGCKHYKIYEATNLIVCEFVDSSERTKCVKDLEDFAIAELEKIKAEIKTNRDEWIKGQDAEWHTYDRCIGIIDKHIEELKGE